MPDEPNVLVIITDQQRFDSLRCYGNDWVQTPNLDALADTSFVFENAYVTQPVCTPARSSLLTGLYPHTTGQVRNAIPMRDDTSTIAELAPSDYHCAYFGKWHLGNDTSAQHGFAEWVPVGKDAADASTSRSYEAFLERNGVELPPAHVRPGGDGGRIGACGRPGQPARAPDAGSLGVERGDRLLRAPIRSAVPAVRELLRASPALFRPAR